MAAPLTHTSTVAQARAYFDLATPDERLQFALKLGGLIYASDPTTAPEDLVVLIGAVAAILTERTVHTELDPTGLIMDYA